MPAVVHFEIPADDVERAKKFYTELFGWQIEDVPDMDYTMITTGADIGINGGLLKREDPRQGVTNYVEVASVESEARRVEQLGGKIMMPKTPVKGMGYFVVCLDTENNPFGLWEENPDAGLEEVKRY